MSQEEEAVHVEEVPEGRSTPKVPEAEEDEVPVGPSVPISDSPPLGWVRGRSGKLRMVGVAREKTPILDDSIAQDVDASNRENGSREPGKHERSRESSTSSNEVVLEESLEFMAPTEPLDLPDPHGQTIEAPLDGDLSLVPRWMTMAKVSKRLHLSVLRVYDILADVDHRGTTKVELESTTLANRLATFEKCFQTFSGLRDNPEFAVDWAAVVGHLFYWQELQQAAEDLIHQAACRLSTLKKWERIAKQAKRKEMQAEELAFKQAVFKSEQDLEKAKQLTATKQREHQELIAATPKSNPDEFIASTSSQHDGQGLIKLPKISMPIFSGDITEWETFRDQFESQIHSRPISTISKFVYLRKALRGQAFESIKGYRTTTAGYNDAWNFLCERYGDQQKVLREYMEKLKTLPRAYERNTSSLVTTWIKVEQVLRGMANLEQNVENNYALFDLVISKLPTSSIVDMKREASRQKKPFNMAYLRTELEEIIKAKEFADVYSQNDKPPGNFRENRRNQYDQEHPFQLHAGEKFQKYPRDRAIIVCVYCEGSDHWGDTCPVYTTLSARKEKLRGKCFVCLRTGHMLSACRRQLPCYHCGAVCKHHRSLCPLLFSQKDKLKGGTYQRNQPRDQRRGRGYPQHPADIQLSLHAKTRERVTLFQTAVTVVYNTDDPSRCRRIRLLFDSGSSRSFVTESTARYLGLRARRHEDLSLCVFSDKSVKKKKSAVVSILFRPRFGSPISFELNTIDVISGQSCDVRLPKLPPGICLNNLADHGESFYPDSSFDLILGLRHIGFFLKSQQVRIGEDLFLQSSSFGNLLFGSYESDVAKHLTESLTVFAMFSETAIDPVSLPDQKFALCNVTSDTFVPNIESWWSLESLGIQDDPSFNDNDRALKHFRETVKFENGKFIVHWPFSRDPKDLPSNFGLAWGRLKSLLNGTLKDHTLRKRYDDVFQDYLQKGIIEPVPPNEMETSNPLHYLCHQAVIREEAKSTKIRVVFDASAAVRGGLSLNQCLYSGPPLTGKLLDILLRFRLRPVGLVSDLQMAYLQIHLAQTQKDVTRFLWLKHIDRPLCSQNVQVYRMNRAGFGVSSSGFFLDGSLHIHLESQKTEFASKLRRDIYVDNPTQSLKSNQEGIMAYRESKRIFAAGGWNARRYSSNSEVVMKEILDADRDDDPDQNVLGLTWHRIEDTLQLTNHFSEKDLNPKTKREALSVISKIFDPYSLSNPGTLEARLLLQDSWKDKSLGWDVRFPHELEVKWKEVVRKLPLLCEFTVPRFIGLVSESTCYELICFSDSSARAYAANVYLRVSNAQQVVVNLLYCKSRLCPLADLSICRKELIGAILGNFSIRLCIEAIDVPVKKSYLLVDSKVVLHWLGSTQPQSKFVNNRVRTLRKLPNTSFRYVSTSENPADYGTKPVEPEVVCKNSFWLHGPEWLVKEESHWPSYNSTELWYDTAKIPNPEFCGFTKVTIDESEQGPFGMSANRFSSLYSLYKATAFVMRAVTCFLVHCKRRQPGDAKRLKEFPVISASELRQVRDLWDKSVQRTFFKDVFDHLLRVLIKP